MVSRLFSMVDVPIALAVVVHLPQVTVFDVKSRVPILCQRLTILGCWVDCSVDFRIVGNESMIAPPSYSTPQGIKSLQFHSTKYHTDLLRTHHTPCIPFVSHETLSQLHRNDNQFTRGFHLYAGRHADTDSTYTHTAHKQKLQQKPSPHPIV